MDQRTLVVSCVEYYSDLKNIPSNKAVSYTHLDVYKRQAPDSEWQYCLPQCY